MIARQQRQTILWEWVKQSCPLPPATMVAMPADASFRRYFRIQCASTSMTYIAVDVPPTQEDCTAFIAIAKLFLAAGLSVPEVIAHDKQHGFLLLSDLGEHSYLNSLTTTNAGLLYQQALYTLTQLHNIVRQNPTPRYCFPTFHAKQLWAEWLNINTWLIEKWLQLPPARMLDQCFMALLQSATQQPQVLIHRDFHSANLMVLPDNRVGILDFQDACIGPITYDAVSLLRDCYIDWPRQQVETWAKHYQALLETQDIIKPITPELFLQWFDWMGIERHLKALFIFARKAQRDADYRYLQHFPRILDYLIDVSKDYAQLKPLHHYLVTTIQPACEQRCAR